MEIIRVLEFQDHILLQEFLQRPVPMASTGEPGLGNDPSKIIQVYFDSTSSMHVVVYLAPDFS